MEKFICSNCGKEFFCEPFYFDGKPYCQECKNVKFTVCEVCGHVNLRESLQMVVTQLGEKLWCSDCVANESFTCTDCGRRIDQDYIHYIGSRIVCNECTVDNYYYCDECERYVEDDDWNEERGMCCNCSGSGSNLIDDYHSNSDFYFRGEQKKNWRGVWRGLGIELEIDRKDEDYNSEIDLADILNSKFNNSLYMEHDGSLEYGFEIITYPHTVKEFYKIPWNEILSTCRKFGYFSHDMETCGLHVHVSRQCFGATEKLQQNAISKIIYFYEKYWADILLMSRRTESQADEWAKRYCVSTRKEALHYSKNGLVMGRYYAINLTNSQTVEFRLGRGTLNSDSFYSWIDFTLTLVKNSRKVKWNEIDNLSAWLNGLKCTTISYMRNRNLFIAEGEKLCA